MKPIFFKKSVKNLNSGPIYYKNFNLPNVGGVCFNKYFLKSNQKPLIKSLKSTYTTHTFYKTKVFATNYRTPTYLKNLNYLPILVSKNRVKNSFLKKNLISIFFTLKVSKLINLPIFLKLEALKFSILFINMNINVVFKKFRRYANFFGGVYQLFEFVVTSFFTLITKDLNFFTNWLKKKFESIFYRKHKKLLYLIKLFFTNYLYIYLSMFNCWGFYFKIRGKIGVGGNSKKKKYLIRLGRHSLTTKKLIFVSNHGNIRTLVGSLGFTLYLFYY
jgi:hypothetical protein